MADNDVDAIYSTQPQIDFARRMAESLLKQGNYVPDAAMAKLPGTWMYGVPNIIRAISGAQYRDIAGGQQEKLAAGITGRQPNQVNRYGARISQPNPANAPAETKISSLNPDQPQQGPGDDFIHKLVTIESGGNPNASTGSYRGLGQFGPSEEKRYGINDSNWNDPQVATNAIKQHMAWLIPQLTEKLGRPPTDGELYLAHQQGVAGGPALLNNPDAPAWKAIRPYYKSDEMAKLAISGNIPRGNYLKSIPIDEVKASDFAKLWTSRFDTQEQLPKAVAGGNPIAGANAPPVNVPGTTVDMTGKMGLGGPTPGGPMPGGPMPGGPMPGGPMPGGPQPNAGAPPGAPPAQLAQAQGIPQVPNANPQISPGNNIGGFGIPPANPAYHPQQLDALIRSADPKDYPKIINDYFKQLQGSQYKNIYGITDVRPSGAPGQPDVVTRLPPESGIPISIGNLGLTMTFGPKGEPILLSPKGDQINSLSDLNKLGAELGVQGESIKKIGEAQVNPITEAISRGGENATKAAQTLRTMENVVKNDKNISMGPTSTGFNELKRTLSNFLPGQASGIASADTLEKLTSLLASESTKAISSNRGTNFELQMFTRANPNLMQSREGMLMMIDILKQEMQQRSEIASIANKWRGKDPAGWMDRQREYYNDHPITIHMPLGNGQYRDITTKEIKTEEDLKGLKSGMWFLSPNGKPAQVP